MKKMGRYIILVCILVMGLGMTVMAMSPEREGDISEEQYEAMEQEYLDEVRQILMEKGCKNAGLTLTYIVNAREERIYTVTVHHRRLNAMEEWEICLLKARAKENCHLAGMYQVNWKFL